ncbi:MAG: HK97 family phage prohead protease [Alphaproteobacteria bacterium]|jgi:uncharacterized protein|nr:HK97 family phage prohead protease [Alphaproteobacteria bacterium]MBT5390617.1 HK97 family phage prohead protease [Alphaproteobacteria bacterium]MBT5654720.1 HK97 family phage prohead protease [Alphaproteobacteria bacterium]
MPKPSGKAVEKRLCNFDIKSLTPKGVLKGYASVFDVIDAQKDRIAQGAFYSSLKRWQDSGQKPKLLWQHDTTELLGVWTCLKEDKRGLYGEAKLLLDVQKAWEAYILLKEKALEGLSIGFETILSSFDENKHVRTLHQVELYEISLVTFAANTAARVHHIH